MQPRNRYNHRRILLAAIVTALVLVAAYAAGQAWAAERATPTPHALGHTAAGAGEQTPATHPQPTKAPTALLRARAACPIGKPLKCRAALMHAYANTAWQKHARLQLAREMLGKLTDWTCIHHGEAAWNANTGNGYHGGLQMDWPFMRTYGRDMLQRHGGRGAEAWTPREQIIVAQRAYAQNRGYNPWPNTSRACGLR